MIKGTHTKLIWTAAGLVVWITVAITPPSAVAQFRADAFLETIEKQLESGREREAYQTLSALRRLQDPSLITPRFLLLEAEAQLMNGLSAEAQSTLESLREMPTAMAELDESEILAVELKVLKALGQIGDALLLIESRLPGLDELDPPYPGSVVQLYLVYSDLLLASLQNERAVRILFDLMEHSEPRLKATVANTLLDAAEQQSFSKEQWASLPEVLARAEGTILWSSFSETAFESGQEEIARSLLLRGIQEDPIVMRARWALFLDSIAEPEFLKIATDTVLSDTVTATIPSNPDFIAIRAITLEKTGREEEAIQVIRESLWEDLNLRMRVARMLAAHGDIAGASGVYQELEAGAPGRFLEPWGTMLVENGKPEKAIEVWSKIPMTEKSIDRGYYRLGQVLKSQGFLEEAAKAIEEGIRQSPQPGLFSTEFLDVAVSLGDVERALAAYQLLRSHARQVGGLWSPQRLIDKLRQSQRMDQFATRLNEVLNATATLSAPWRDVAVEMQTDLLLQINAFKTLATWIESPPQAVVAYWARGPEIKRAHFEGIANDLSLRGEYELAFRFFHELGPEYLKESPTTLEAAARAAGHIGASTQAHEFWNVLLANPRCTPEQRVRAGIAIVRIQLDAYRPGKALEVMGAIPDTLGPDSQFSEIEFLRALAYTQLHDKTKALPLLESISLGQGNHAMEAAFWLAEWELWQRNYEEAERRLRELLQSDPGAEMANEILWRLRYLKNAEPEVLPALSLALFFEGSGEWAEAEKNYRDLAAALGATSDLTDWIYYRIGEMLVDAGELDRGLQQWRVLKEKSTNQALIHRLRYEVAALPQDASGESFEALVFEAPNTLVGDLAREKMEQSKAEEVPTPVPPPMVP